MNEDFNKANEKVHPVEYQWHYSILTRHGFEAVTKEAKGFVRAYTYKHPDGREITCNTGVSADYWTDKATGKGGYWADLEPYITR